MKFYDIADQLEDAITAADSPVRLKIEIAFAGHFESVFEQDIVEAHFSSMKQAAGGISSRGELIINNAQFIIHNEETAGLEVRVSFSMGEGLPFFRRFTFQIDDKGIQDVRGPGRKRLAYIGLRDLSEKLQKTSTQNEWLVPAVFINSVVCDKYQPDNSLVHRIAQIAGLTVDDIDCSSIPVTLPLVKLSGNVWAELSSLATAYRCHLECGNEKPLVFTGSPYQIEEVSGTQPQEVLEPGTHSQPPTAACEWSQAPKPQTTPEYTFTGNDIFYLRKFSRADLYRNTVCLKFNLPVSLEKHEIAQYEIYSQAHYPVIPQNEFDGNLIASDMNRLCLVRDSESVATRGNSVLNVTGSYFSDYQIDGRTHFEDWAIKELAERLQPKKEFTVKTHRAIFHARVGAQVQVTSNREQVTGVINGFSLRYRKDKAFVATFKILEGGNCGAEKKI